MTELMVIGLSSEGVEAEDVFGMNTVRDSLSSLGRWWCDSQLLSIKAVMAGGIFFSSLTVRPSGPGAESARITRKAHSTSSGLKGGASAGRLSGVIPTDPTASEGAEKILS